VTVVTGLVAVATATTLWATATAVELTSSASSVIDDLAGVGGTASVAVADS
jgi:hypothetical protein